MLISPEYAEQNRQLHADNFKYGTTGNQWAYYVAELVRVEGYKSVLDFGAGKGVMKGMLGEFGISNVAEFDPAVAGKEATPEPAELVLATDVLEHIEPEHLLEVMVELARLTRLKLFVDICTAPAIKTLPDGRNPHLIVKPPEWWHETLSRHFDVTHWVPRPDLCTVYGELVPKGMGPSELALKAIRPKRRKLSPELSSMVGRLIGMSRASHDELGRVRTVRFYEGDGDEPADMQIVWDILDDVPDDEIDGRLEAICRLGRKEIILRVGLSDVRTDDWWKAKVDARWHIVDFVHDDGSAGIVGIPKCTVEGVKVVGAVGHDDRWDQVAAAIARFSKRIRPSEPHGRRAILACYGPSLTDMLPRIKAEMGEALCDVVSVSGSHDFLIENGIVPAFHVECDPRPHKADNIDKGHPDVDYLIGSVAHPRLFDKIADCNVSLWHVADQDHAQRLLRAGERGNHIISGGGSVGLRAMSLLYSLGYRDFSVYAMDCSFADDGRQWAGKHAGKQHEQMQIKLLCGGREFLTSPVLASYATDFIEMIQKMDAQIRVYGDGLLAAMCRMHNTLAAKANGGIVDRLGFLFPAQDREWNNIVGSCRSAIPKLLNLAPKRDLVIQAGGNVGVLPQLLSEHFGKVITFEPDAENFALMEQNVTARNVVKRQAALGARSGRSALTRKPNNCGGHYLEGDGGDVPVETIDRLGVENCDLIVLDVEGFEYHALLGAAQTIAAHKPAIMLEDNGLSERYGTPKGAAQQWLMDRFGYEIVETRGRDVLLRCA